ncbi:MAG: CBS domain-containing protein [Euryarchaeota archaeon]|nr:CBS domain-containing protein [Euryarchaeota archaeon]
MDTSGADAEFVLDASLLMNPEIVRVQPGMEVTEVARLMIERDISCVAVARGEEIVGVITDRDFTRCAAMEKHASRAEELMSSPVITVSYREDLKEIARKMGDNNIRHIFVEKNGRIVGIISLRDILKIMPEAIYCYLPRLEMDKRK